MNPRTKPDRCNSATMSADSITGTVPRIAEISYAGTDPHQAADEQSTTRVVSQCERNRGGRPPGGSLEVDRQPRARRHRLRVRRHASTGHGCRVLDRLRALDERRQPRDRAHAEHRRRHAVRQPLVLRRSARGDPAVPARARARPHALRRQARHGRAQPDLRGLPRPQAVRRTDRRRARARSRRDRPAAVDRPARGQRRGVGRCDHRRRDRRRLRRAPCHRAPGRPRPPRHRLPRRRRHDALGAGRSTPPERLPRRDGRTPDCPITSSTSSRK